MIVLFCIPSEQKPQEPGHRQHLMAPQSKPAPGAGLDSRRCDVPHPQSNRRRGLRGASGRVLLALTSEHLEASGFLSGEQTLGDSWFQLLPPLLCKQSGAA